MGSVSSCCQTESTSAPEGSTTNKSVPDDEKDATTRGLSKKHKHKKKKPRDDGLRFLSPDKIKQDDILLAKSEFQTRGDPETIQLGFELRVFEVDVKQRMVLVGNEKLVHKQWITFNEIKEHIGPDTKQVRERIQAEKKKIQDEKLLEHFTYQATQDFIIKDRHQQIKVREGKKIYAKEVKRDGSGTWLVEIDGHDGLFSLTAEQQGFLTKYVSGR